VDGLRATKSEDVGLIDRAKFRRFPTCVITIHQRYRQTDGRTDDMRSQDRALHYSVSRGKNQHARLKFYLQRNFSSNERNVDIQCPQCGRRMPDMRMLDWKTQHKNWLKIQHRTTRLEQEAVLSHGGPRDAAVNFATYRSLQRHRAVFTAMATLLN